MFAKRSVFSVLLLVTGVVLLVVFAVLGHGGTFNDDQTSNSLSQLYALVGNELPNVYTADDYPQTSIEHTILQVPPYQLSTRKEEYELEREQQVLNKVTASTRIDHPLINSNNNNDDDDEEKQQQQASGLEKFVQCLYYINFENSPDQRKHIEQYIANLRLPASVERKRVSKIDNQKSKFSELEHQEHVQLFLSHIACLSKVLPNKQHVLILQDDFQSNMSCEELLTNIELIDRETNGRWDVIQLHDQHTKLQPFADHKQVARVLCSESTQAYLVNKHYVPHLLTFLIQQIRVILQKDTFLESFEIRRVIRELQTRDCWYTVQPKLNNNKNNNYQVKLTDAFQSRRVAICHVATGKYNNYVKGIQKDCYQKFLKPHPIEFFLFTNQPELYQTKTEEGVPLHVYTIDRQGFPGDTLYRYKYILQAKQEFKDFDHMFYMDVDFRVFSPPDESQLLVPTGTVATAHLHNIMEKRHTHDNHIGTPETNPNSTACIRPHERMDSYFAGGFQGGEVKSYLQAVQVMHDNIETDQANNVLAKYHDESHWNRYCLDHPPASILSQNYMYVENCLQASNKDKVCQQLRKGDFKPVFIPLEKNHSQVRAT